MAASKYHTNFATGETSLCRARLGNCPFGGDLDHYTNADDARKAYELTQKLAAIPTVASTKKIVMEAEGESQETARVAKLEAEFDSIWRKNIFFDSDGEVYDTLKKQYDLLTDDEQRREWRKSQEQVLAQAAGQVRRQGHTSNLDDAMMENYNHALISETMGHIIEQTSDLWSTPRVSDYDKFIAQRRLHLVQVNALHGAMQNTRLKRKMADFYYGGDEDRVNYILTQAQNWFLKKKNSQRTLAEMVSSGQRFPGAKPMAQGDREVRGILRWASNYAV